MGSFLDNLAKKPEPVRRRIFYASIIVVAPLILVIWFLNFKYTLQKVAQEPKESSQNQIVWGEITRQVGQGRENLKELLADLNITLPSLSQTKGFTPNPAEPLPRANLPLAE